MHEFALIQSVLEMVKDSAVQNRIKKVNRVKLVVGKFSMALPDSLHFAFDAIKATEDLFQNANLEIEEREIIGSCQQCQQAFQMHDRYCFVCPSCNSTGIEIIQGRELYLDYYEGEEN
ncbi:MAG: hydrogenase maturation nickel metallochaperone HypA [Syntrophomonadales bacterium]|jgi:hydrogenase nickel incorporation protein HypA/HybF